MTYPPLSVLTNSSTFDFTHHTIMQLCQNMTKLLQNLSAPNLFNTVHIDTTQPEAYVQESTPTQPVEQLQLIITTEKMGIASQLVEMFTQEGGSVTETTPDKGILTVAKGTPVSGLITNPETLLKEVLEMQC
jgi:hypothetical protein